MARSQTNLASKTESTPGFKAAADTDESARWEAYCALQARKRSNGMQPSFEREVSFDPSATGLAGHLNGGFARADRPPAFDRPVAIEAMPADDNGELTPRVDNHGRKALPIAALAVVAGGIVIAGSMFSLFPGATHGDNQRVVPHAVVQSRPALSPVLAATSVAPPSPPAIATQAPRSTERPIAWPKSHRVAVAASHTRDAGVRQHRQEVATRQRPNPPPKHAHDSPAMLAAAGRPKVQDRVFASVPVDHATVRARTELQQRDTVASERPASAQRLMEYRASQAAYERNLKSYEQAMARYYDHGAAGPPPAPSHSTDPASALDSLPWRR